jgi:cytochrome c oxidase subunit 2
MLVLITVTMIYFVIKYDRKNHPKATQIDGSTKLEIIWTVIPTIIVLAMFYYGWEGFKLLRSVPDGAMVVHVTGRMWEWKFIYENGRESKILYVPQDIPVKLLMTSQDVVHSFYIPAFRIKEDTVPGMETYLWFQAKETGSYDVFCAEYCGTLHSEMITKLVVMTDGEFKKWYGENTITPVREAKGYRLIKEKNCIICHSLDGSKLIGPPLKGIFGTKIKVMTDGRERTVTVDETYLKTSILDPQADIVSGYEKIPMAQQKGLLTDKEIDEIVKYLKELK